MPNDQDADKLLEELGLDPEVAGDVRDITDFLVELAYDSWSSERKKTSCQQKTP